jgi:hypothetical protein
MACVSFDPALNVEFMYELAKLTAWMKKHIKYFLLRQFIRNYKWIDSKSDSIFYSKVSHKSRELGIFLSSQQYFFEIRTPFCFLSIGFCRKGRILARSFV